MMTSKIDDITKAFNLVVMKSHVAGYIDCDCGAQIHLLDFAYAAWCHQCGQKWNVDWEGDIAAQPRSGKKKPAGRVRSRRKK